MLSIHSMFYDDDALSNEIRQLALKAYHAHLRETIADIDLNSGFGLRLARRCLTKPDQMAQYIANLNISARHLLKIIAAHYQRGRCLLMYDMQKSYWQEYVVGNKSCSATHKYIRFFHCLDDWQDLYDDFLSESFIQCNDCDNWESRSSASTNHTDEYICRRCISNGYFWSDYDDCYVHHDYGRWVIDRHGDEIQISDRELQDSSYTWSDEQDRYIHEDYEQPSRVLNSYHSGAMPYEPIMSPWVKKYQQDTSERNTPLKGQWFGLELEVECSDAITSEAESLHKKLVGHSSNVLRRLDTNFYSPFFKFERDGSLSNGWEIITQPAGLDVHRAWWQWLKMDDFRPSCLSSETASTCGLHIHVNKSSLTPLTMTKIAGFINSPNNASLIKTVARRYNQSFAKIKNKGPGKTPSGKTVLASPFEIYKHHSHGKSVAESKSSNDRYDAFNLTNHKSVECRLFQGTLSYPRIIAALEFVYSICRYCHDSSGYGFDLTQESFMKFINSQPMLKETLVLRNFIELNERI